MFMHLADWRRTILFLIACSVFAGVPQARADDKKESTGEKFNAVGAFLKQSVDSKKIGGGAALIYQRGHSHLITTGFQDIDRKTAITPSTLFRIASMSKPITSVAVMMLVEDGKIKVTDPLSKFVPEFKDMKVLVPSKDGKAFELVKANREITIHDLLTHSSGITYRLFNKPFIAKMYADAGVSDGISETDGTIGDNVKRLAKMPLVCQPGAAWEYGLNTDVLGYVVEVASGKTLDAFFHERIFKPLEMNDTFFIVPKEKRDRLATIYATTPDKGLIRFGDKPVTMEASVLSATYPVNDKSKYYSGGAGLVSTIGDYARFCQMLLNKGEFNRVRVLKAATVEQMTRNQLGELRIMFPGNDLMGYGFGVLSEKGKETSKDPAGVGTYAWGGAFGTYFWIDPKNELIGIYTTQMFPPDFALGGEFKKLVYEAIK